MSSLEKFNLLIFIAAAVSLLLLVIICRAFSGEKKMRFFKRLVSEACRDKGAAFAENLILFGETYRLINLDEAETLRQEIKQR